MRDTRDELAGLGAALIAGQLAQQVAGGIFDLLGASAVEQSRELDGYWTRSTGARRAASPDALQALGRAALERHRTPQPH